MSDLLKDQNEFDHIVKKQPYRIEFLEEFGKGWKQGTNPGHLNSFQIHDKLKFFLTFIKKVYLQLRQMKKS